MMFSELPTRRVHGYRKDCTSLLLERPLDHCKIDITSNYQEKSFLSSNASVIFFAVFF